MSLVELEQSFPAIPWREPIRVTTTAGSGWACRICIAQKGLRGQDVPSLPSDPAAVTAHIEAEHG